MDESEVDRILLEEVKEKGKDIISCRDLIINQDLESASEILGKNFMKQDDEIFDPDDITITATDAEANFLDLDFSSNLVDLDQRSFFRGIFDEYSATIQDGNMEIINLIEEIEIPKELYDQERITQEELEIPQSLSAKKTTIVEVLKEDIIIKMSRKTKVRNFRQLKSTKSKTKNFFQSNPDYEKILEVNERKVVNNSKIVFENNNIIEKVLKSKTPLELSVSRYRRFMVKNCPISCEVMKSVVNKYG
jgi:hypothetical protein